MVYNPARRNRNIGTAKQGYGQNNKLTIAGPCGTLSSFYERLVHYKKIEQIINGHDFLFIVEQTRRDSKHSCSVNDITKIIQHIPQRDYGDLKYIILRQPKRKEEIVAPAWGRLIYSYEFEGKNLPAIMLDAVDFTQKLKWPARLSVDSQKELNRLRDDGHKIANDGRHFVAPYELENVRNTQLYRTLLHEFGHYVHYLESVERPAKTDESYESWEKRYDKYFQIPTSEKEEYAHRYADALKMELISKKIIPFAQKDDPEDKTAFPVCK